MSSLAIASSVLGGAGVILLSIFDTKRFQNLHRVFLLVFMVGVAFSAIFTVAEVSFRLVHECKILIAISLRG